MWAIWASRTKQPQHQPEAAGFRVEDGAASEAAGKSMLIARLAQNGFTDKYAPMIGVDFAQRTIDLPWVEGKK